MDASPLRDRRVAAGLTQAELAARAGVSRQLVAAAESGRNSPGVDAALGLAAALGTSVEDLFGPARQGDVVSVLGGYPPDGSLVRVGRVGDRTVAAPLTDHGIAGAGWAVPDGVISDGALRMFPGARPMSTVVAGCDPALGLAAALLDDRGPRSLLNVPASTGQALAALDAGTVHAAVVHDRERALPSPPVAVARWHLARWRVGIAVPTDSPARTVAEVLAVGPPVVQRPTSATSQQAFLRALARDGLAPPDGPVAAGHLDAARTASMTDGAAVTNEAAARAFGLRFLPLETHVVEVWVDARWADLPGISALGEVISSAAFADRLAGIGGYDLTDTGTSTSAADPGPGA
jgi:DNA-binding XRE family transcriptional regulator